eukprot:CAMPEP_0202970280 /NCGR_PEP_ID=MMETSP1396-20130829/16256_1 /ASSEMBLY_ACC=CAM_ASM_000872 /TAXON_ID= /ORGANISM="Pseudokeronopsis sp., Strain Brazil" /LENGTH=149 /DNA_ID=CAMNT_0049698683 /DNA_START=709 /DNA_END=1158 /DNA_ORIENTATION=-
MFALGGDIGGSIRMPANHCGIFGIRFTSQRVSREHLRLPNPQNFCPFDYIQTSPGPLARTFEDLLCLSKLMLSAPVTAQDPTVPPLSFADHLYSSTLRNKGRIGYFDSFQLAPTSPSVKRAIRMAKEALEAQGYELVPFRLTYEEQVEA